MPISVPGVVLSKVLLEREGVPEDRQRQLMLVGGAAPFPMGVVVAQLVARREAPSVVATGTQTGPSGGTGGREAAVAEARHEALAAAEAAESARAAAEATEEAAQQAARAAAQAARAAQEAIETAQALREEFEPEDDEQQQS
jgi:hypothetical protein